MRFWSSLDADFWMLWRVGSIQFVRTSSNNVLSGAFASNNSLPNHAFALCYTSLPVNLKHDFLTVTFVGYIQDIIADAHMFLFSKIELESYRILRAVISSALYLNRPRTRMTPLCFNLVSLLSSLCQVNYLPTCQWWRSKHLLKGVCCNFKYIHMLYKSLMYIKIVVKGWFVLPSWEFDQTCIRLLDGDGDGDWVPVPHLWHTCYFSNSYWPLQEHPCFC